MANFESHESTFDHLQLNKQFHFLGLESDQSKESDFERPSKRQKISKKSVSELSSKTLVESETIGEVTTGICQLFGSGEILDLVGLEKVAE